jgi:hypothetical protein
MEPILYDMIKSAELPELVPVRRKYVDDALADVSGAVAAALEQGGIEARLPHKASVAITVGSRGIAKLPEIVAATVGWFKHKGAEPFIIPAMGSHGGATAEGQARALIELGVSEESAGCPIRSSMEVVQVGALLEGQPVYVDAIGSRADAIFILNRVKPHTAFTGDHESGLIKMITIGLGKQLGADSCHLAGFGAMADLMLRMAKVSLANSAIIGALGIVENAHDRLQYVEAVTADQIIDCDKRLLIRAAANMPALPVDYVHVLMLDEMGKNISGAGLDGNITGRYATPYRKPTVVANKVLVLDLTPESEGNATGMGNADIITGRLHRSIDFVPTYANAITTTLFKSVFTPLVADTDQNAILCAIKTCNAESGALRFIRIKNTLKPLDMLVSPDMAELLKGHSDCVASSLRLSMRFAADGTLLERDIWNGFDEFFN